MDCTYLHGRASLESYTNDSNYAASAYSFEFASQDATLTHNEWDVVYQEDTFVVNTVTDDKSFIVDLGPIALKDVPATLTLAAYPTGEWGDHDAIEAQLNHAYYVRTVNNSGRLVAAFQVSELEPGRKVNIEWIRSTDPDTMIVPTACGL
jgi:hypothetical protein